INQPNKSLIVLCFSFSPSKQALNNSKSVSKWIWILLYLSEKQKHRIGSNQVRGRPNCSPTSKVGNRRVAKPSSPSQQKGNSAFPRAKEGEREREGGYTAGMGKKKAKSSRKGKKEWRSNISTADIDDFFSETTKDAQSGGSLSGLPAKSLFFLDSSPDLSVKRKIEKHRSKVLHCESLLQRNEFVQVIPAPKQKKPKMKLPSAAKRNSPVQTAEATVSKALIESDGNSTSMLVDLWENKDGHDTKVHKKTSVSSIPAVEIEPPGCSFNPSFESHQDSLALAVAGEMQKIYQRELGPQPVPKTVPGSGLDEEEMFFLDVDEGEDEDQETHVDNGVEQQRSIKAKRLTRADINRRARRKEQLKAELEAKEQERVLKEIDCLPDIIKKIEKEDQEKQRRHIRRVVAKQEKAKSGPPRLGKYKFEPAPVQVLLSEEVTGSLRQLKACSTLAKDRFKSLEKRGLVVPQAKHHRSDW
ncbi:Uncharacterized protein EJ110_NYTH34032, partial [Nymphaea thermarum]